jgi:hypothetical protein
MRSSRNLRVEWPIPTAPKTCRLHEPQRKQVYATPLPLSLRMIVLGMLNNYGPTVLETLLFTPTTVHSTLPIPRLVHPGFPTVVCPKRVKPTHEVPLNSSTHRALSVTPKTPHTSSLAAKFAQLPLAPTKPPRLPHPVQDDADHVPPVKRFAHSAVSVPRATHMTSPATPKFTQLGSPVPLPPVLINPSHFVPS